MVHLGTYFGGHYIAISKRNNKWFKFNDERVTKIKSTRYLLNNKAYVLIYKSRNLGL